MNKKINGISYKFEQFFELLSKKEENLNKYKDIRYIILIGGRASGKSHALAAWVNTASYKKGWGVLFTRWTMKSAETSIIPEFKKLWKPLNNANDFSSVKTIITNTVSGTIIDFKGIKPQSSQSSGALKSVAGKNIFIVEEAEDCPDFELFDKIDNSIRTCVHKNFIILCLNQGHTDHWIHKEFIKEYRDDTLILESNYLDNIRYLDKVYLKKIQRAKERNYARYQHIYLNKWKEDVEGALWNEKDISDSRITKDEYRDNIEDHVTETVIAFDPAVTDSKAGGYEDKPDEDGIIVAARAIDKYYILHDKSLYGKRSNIAQKLVDYYYNYDLNCLVIEKNNGGDWIPSLIKTVDMLIRIKTVSATKGKVLRAQPIQSMYEQGLIHHVGHFSELEYEMTTWVPDSNMKSPNRIDAMVWALTYLSGKKKEFKVFVA